MTEGFAGIIAQLEKQKTSIEKALAALQVLDGTGSPSMGSPAATRSPRNLRAAGQMKRWAAKHAAELVSADPPDPSTGTRRKFSAAARRKMALAQKARWAKIKDASAPSSTDTPDAPKSKRRISAEGIKRIIAATKKRWRLKRAAAKVEAAKTVAPVRRSPKKAAAAPAQAITQAAG